MIFDIPPSDLGRNCAVRGTSTNSSKWGTENGSLMYQYRRWEQRYLAVCTTPGHDTDFICLSLPAVQEIICKNTFSHPESPKIRVVSHIDIIYDGHCMFLWTLQKQWKIQNLTCVPHFACQNRIHILFFSPGTTYWDHCCTTKKPVTETAGSTLFRKVSLNWNHFFLTYLWTLLITNCS